MLLLVILIINLSSITCAVQLESKLFEIRTVRPESKLIRELNTFFDFDYNIYVSEASRDFNQFIDVTEQPIIVPQSLYIVNGSVVNRANVVSKIKSKNAFLIVIPDSIKSSLILLKEMRDKKLQKYSKIAVFFTHEVSSGDLRTLFEWCWINLIVNIFAASYNSEETTVSNSERSLHIFTYNPFGTFDVIDVTHSMDYDDFFLRQNSNFQNYTLYLQELFGKLYVRISDENLWNAVFRQVNASFTGHRDNRTIAFYGKDVYILPRVFDVVYSYQLTMYMYMTTTMILVPEALPYSEFSAYLVTITSGKYKFFGYSFITIGGLILLLSFIRYTKQKKILLFQSIADVFNLLFNDNGLIHYRQLTRVEVFIIVPLTFVGMVIVNGILSNLKSYLTRPTVQPQINTADDLHKSGLPIYSYDKLYADLGYKVLSNSSPNLNWSNRFFAMDPVTFDEQKEMFNRSAAFIEDLSYAKTILKAQKLLDIKGYHIPQFYLATWVCSYHVYDEFPFIERFYEIVQRIVTAGLYDLWLKMDFTKREKNILKLNAELTQKDNDIDRFPLPMFIVYGWCASVIIVVLEIIWKKFKFSQFKRWRNQLQGRIGYQKTHKVEPQNLDQGRATVEILNENTEWHFRNRQTN